MSVPKTPAPRLTPSLLTAAGSALRARSHEAWRASRDRDVAAPAAPEPMGRWTVVFLVAYLTVLAVGGGWTLVTLWGAAPPLAPTSGAEGTAPVPGATDTAPRLTRLVPDTLLPAAGRRSAILVGAGFRATSRVVVDGVAHGGGRYLDPGRMILELGDADFQRPGVRLVGVEEGGVRSAALPLVVRSESDVRVAWSPPLGAQRSLTLEVRFILLVLAMGGLGGVLASFNSLAGYRGAQKLTRNWFLHYWVSPFLAAGVAFLLYVVIRAGFLSGTSLDLGEGATPWGTLAVAGLAGLFYDKTLLKLREVFVTLFSPRDDRGGKLEDPPSGALAISTTSLPPASVGAAYTARLTATGGRAPYSWTVDPPLPPGLDLDPLTGVIQGTPAQTAFATHTFTLSDMVRATAQARMVFEVR